MTKNSFHDQQIQAQIKWRENNISSAKHCYHNGRPYEHIIPHTLWEETLWQGIRNDLPTYISSHNIQAHTGTHNLLSSWILCANLYFIVRTNPGFKQLILGFLKKHISAKIIGITNTELEFALDGELSPGKLLGEYGGNRGSGQTSPDLAFIVETCPASTAGYQLFRQHALAGGIAETGKYSLVVSSVAFDEGNRTLIDCLEKTGIPDFTTGWRKLFTGKTLFKTWTHKQWVEHVRQNGKEPLQIDWVNYMNNRYGY